MITPVPFEQENPEEAAFLMKLAAHNAKAKKPLSGVTAIPLSIGVLPVPFKRNASCFCGSGKKIKKCCGKGEI